MCAWIIKEEKKQIIVDNNNDIRIPKGETALIETEESIYISKKLCGTYHSRVTLCNKGLSHIGTTLDPCYFGTSVIALHNNSSKDVIIKVGESIVFLMIYDMKTSADELHDNFPFRKDLFDLNLKDFYEEYWRIEGVVCPECEKCGNKENCSNKLLKNDKQVERNKKNLLVQLEKWKKEKWRTNRNELIKKVRRYVSERDMEKNIFKYSIGVLLLGIVSMILLIVWVKNIDYNNNQGFVGAINSIIAVIPPTCAIIIAMIIRYQKKGEI